MKTAVYFPALHRCSLLHLDDAGITGESRCAQEYAEVLCALQENPGVPRGTQELSVLTLQLCGVNLDLFQSEKFMFDRAGV